MSDALVDLQIAGRTADDIAWEIEEALWLKGYCVLDMKLEANLDEALDEVKDLQREGKFDPPAAPVVEGILGSGGSGEIAWLHPAAVTGEKTETRKLEALTQDLFYIADCTKQFFQNQGFGDMTISDTLIVRGGESMVEGTAQLTEASCSRWVSTFLSAKLMMVYFMGPGDGSLELTPNDNESEPLTIKTHPDMLVILRSDVIGRNHVSSSSDYALCSWIMMPSVTRNRGWEAAGTEATDIIPGVRELNEWAEERLQVLAGLDAADQLDTLNAALPRSWQRMVRTSYFRHTNLPVAIKGMGTHSPATQDCEVLWKSFNIGVDYVGNVPLTRWNHEEYYDPDPQCYLTSHTFSGGWIKTSINHAQFIDGIELFDNKFFQISQSESGGMEPQQRHILETSYEGLYMAGYSKKQLMTAYIAVFTGCTNPEAMYIDYTQGAGAGNISQAITSNRTSFVLGIMGPSTSIDCEQASSHMALMVGASAVAPNHDWRNKTGGHSEASITGGVYLTVTPFMWPRFNAYMNPIGRCFTWDASANGYVRGEACTSLCQKRYTDKIDGEWVANENGCLGTMVGWQMVNNGRAASLTAPSAPAIQETVQRAVSEAAIDVLDLEAIECHGNGAQLDDSVEVSALARFLRHEEESELEPLRLGAVKTQTAAQCESCGMTSFLKAMLNISYAVMAPSISLKQVNPYIVMDTNAVFMLNEHMPFRDQYVFHGCSSKSFNGTNTHIIQWFQADLGKVRTERLLSTEQPIAFWPAGGGILDNYARPSDGYYITGSFQDWGAPPEEMPKLNDTTHRYVVTLGANMIERFQIMLDADTDRVLYPSVVPGVSGTAVCGPAPADQVEGMSWIIDGRLSKAEPGAAVAIADKSARPSREDAIAVAEGRPGDKYEIKLSTAGKYRALTWRRVQSGDESSLADPMVQGRYYIVGAWNQWNMQEMTPDPDRALGLYTIEVGPLPLWATRCDFQIVRNRDPLQVFHPPYGGIASEKWDEQDPAGPDAGGLGITWCIKGTAGATFKVEFQRSLQNGQDMRRIAWHKVV